MTQTHPQGQAWLPGQSFMRSHLYWPLACAIVLLTLPEMTSLDLWLGKAWFAWEGGSWSLRNHWLTAGIIHDGGRKLVFTTALSALLLLIASYRSRRLLPWRRPLAYLLTSLLLLTALVASVKHLSSVPCPWNLSGFGGSVTYRHNFQHFLAPGDGGHCFPAGHASGGYALLALYFAAIGRVQRTWVWLIPGLMLGLVFGIAQQARGAHFLSHDLWTLAICWFGCLALFLLMRPDIGPELAR